MEVMPNLIRDVDYSHWNCTVTAFLLFGYDQRVGRITVTDHPLDVPLNVNAPDLIVTPPEDNVVPTFKYSILIIIIDRYHRYEAICQLYNDPNPAEDCCWDPTPEFLTIRANGRALSIWGIMKNIRLLNIAS